LIAPFHRLATLHGRSFYKIFSLTQPAPEQRFSFANKKSQPIAR
jgi:hypothetical protein